MIALSRIRWGIMSLVAVFVIGVVGHHAISGRNWLESIYYFVITVSGVGYTEVSEVSPTQQLFTIFVILFGMLAVGYTLTLLLQLMIEGQIYRALGYRRMTREIEQLEGHTILCGLGRMGKSLAEEFARRGTPFVIVDMDAEIAVAARAEGLLAVTGDALDEESLVDAGIKRAKSIIAALRSDADNVFLTLTARNLNPDLRIIARGEMPATEKKLRQAGADQVVLPAVIGARRMAAYVTRPYAAELMDLMADHRELDAELEEMLVGPDCGLAGKTIREVAIRDRHNVMIIAIRRGDGKMLFNPSASTEFTAGDTIIVMGNQSDLRAFQSSNHLIC